MTAHDERIDRIELRVDRLEDQYRADILAIHGKLDALTKLLSQSMVETAKTACPAPGSCVKLGDRLESVIITHNATMERVERLELHIMKLLQERAYILGGCAVVATVFSMIGVGIGMVFSWFLSKSP